MAEAGRETARRAGRLNSANQTIKRIRKRLDELETEWQRLARESEARLPSRRRHASRP